MTPSASTISGQPDYQLRQSRLTNAMGSANLKLLALNPGPSLVYLTGLQFHLSERPIIAIFSPHLPPTLVMPELRIG